MAEARICPQGGRMTLHRFTVHSIKSTARGVEKLNGETYWKCVTPGCDHKEEELT